jgi:imidazole glycerol-phosphate synthase subunit HisH
VKVVIVNSGVGNVRSVANMLKRVGVAAVISDDPETIEQANSIILPGVGAFDAAMHRFRTSGIKEVLDRKVAAGSTPVLGICLGMQLMGDKSEEGIEPGFGWINGELKRFKSSLDPENPVRVPHMGWNIVTPSATDPLYRNMGAQPRFYFDHSYYFVPKDPGSLSARCTHGVEFASGIRRGLLFGVQFHPEKSHRFGFQLLRNFAEFSRSLLSSANA